MNNEISTIVSAIEYEATLGSKPLDLDYPCMPEGRKGLEGIC